MLKLVLHADTGDVDLEDYLGAVSAALSTLKAIDRRVGGGSRRLGWKLQRLESSEPTTLVLPVPATTTTPFSYESVVISRTIAALEMLEVGGQFPELPDKIVRDWYDVTGRFENGGPSGFSIDDLNHEGLHHHRVRLTRRAYRHIDELLKTSYESIGSVTGEIITVSKEAGRTFVTIRDEVFGNAVKCTDLGGELVTKASAGLPENRRATVTGILTTDSRSRPTAVKRVRDLEILSRRSELPTSADVAGRFPDLTGDLSTEEFLRRQRGHG